MEEKIHSPEQDFYQTGSTQPPKSHSSLVALLLILVILLAGTVSLLGFQNIRLMDALKQSNLSSLQEGHPTTPTTDTRQTDIPALGISGEEVTAVGQHYYQLPAGIYIADVSHSARNQGLRPGDILLSLNGTAIATMKQLQQSLQSLAPGQQVSVGVYRDSEEMTVTLTVEDY